MKTFAGGAVVASPCARIVWRRTFGGYPVTVLPGIVLIADPRMASVISRVDKKVFRYGTKPVFVP